jgi:hypothetical protein
LGYTVGLERSLQVRRPGGETKEPESDITVYDPDRLRHAQPSHHPGTGAGASLIMAVPEMLGITLEDTATAPYRAVAVYRVPKVDQARGEPVAWIELLSPSNKPGGQDAQQYKDRRLALLQSNIVFVEVDLLHESPPTFEGIANYRAQEPEAHPYRISIIDPRPVFMDGLGFTYEFDVDALFPPVTIPLNADDLLEFDFGVGYHTVLEMQGYAEDYVDYTQLPERFDRYSEADQARIVTRMLHIIEQSQRGDPFTETPQELPVMPLQDALSQIEQLKFV